jgi:amino acid transporter
LGFIDPKTYALDSIILPIINNNTYNETDTYLLGDSEEKYLNNLGQLSLTESMFPTGIHGIFQGIPTFVWCFLGVEGLPMVSMEMENYKREGPRAIIWGTFLSLVIYMIQLIICPMARPGGKLPKLTSETFKKYKRG